MESQTLQDSHDFHYVQKSITHVMNLMYETAKISVICKSVISFIDSLNYGHDVPGQETDSQVTSHTVKNVTGKCHGPQDLEGAG